MDILKVDVRDSKKINELDRYIEKLAQDVLRELEKKGFNIDFHFLWKFEQWETDRVDWKDVPVNAEVKIYLSFSTIDSKRYRIQLARLIRNFRKYEVEVELYNVKEALSKLEELPRLSYITNL